MRKIFLYLFIISLLIIIFQLIYSTKKLSFEAERYNHLKKNLLLTRDTIVELKEKLAEVDYFSLETNEDAQNYFIKSKIICTDSLMSKVKNKILSYNEKRKGNSLVPYDPINARNFLINKIKFLNHRWIIADFSNGEIWGEVIIKYFVNDDDTFFFETRESIIYPKD